MGEAVLLGAVISAGGFGSLYALTRTERGLADWVQRWGQGVTMAVTLAAAFCAVPILGAVVFLAVLASFDTASLVRERVAATLRLLGVGGVLLWPTVVLLTPAATEGLGRGDAGAGELVERAGEEALARQGLQQGPSPVYVDVASVVEKSGAPMPWELKGDAAEGLRHPAPESVGLWQLPPPKFEPPEMPKTASTRPRPRRSRPDRPPPGPPPSVEELKERVAEARGSRVLEAYRNGFVPNTASARLDVWGVALQLRERDVLKELTHPSAQGVLREIARGTVDDVTLEALRARYAEARNVGWIRRKGTRDFVAIVQIGGLFGPRVQFVCRQYQGLWRVYEIRDRGLKAYLEEYTRQHGSSDSGQEPPASNRTKAHQGDR